MPWHAEMNSSLNYLDHTIIFKEKVLKSSEKKKSDTDSEDLCVTSIGVNKSRQMLKIDDNSKGLELYQTHQNNSLYISKNENVKQDSRLSALISKYQEVFRDALSIGLPPKRNVYHAIETEKDANPPHRPLFQLSPEELKAAKEYVQ